MPLLSERTARTLASAPAGIAAGGLAGLLAPLDYPRQAAWWLGNRVADLAGDQTEEDYTPESVAGDGVGSMLLSALTDPLTFVGGGVGGLVGRSAGRQVARADEIMGQIKRLAPEYEALNRFVPEIEAGVGQAAARRAAYADDLARARASHEEELQKALQANTVTLGGQTYPVEDAAAALADESSPLVQAILGGQVPGVFTPRLGKKMAPVAEAMEQYGFAQRLPGGQTAVAYEGLSPVLRRRGSSLSVEGYPVERLGEMDPGPFHRINNPLPLPEFTPPVEPPPLTTREVLMNSPLAGEAGSGRALGSSLEWAGEQIPMPQLGRLATPFRVRGRWVDANDLMAPGPVSRAMDAPVEEVHPLLQQRLEDIRGETGAVAAQANQLPFFGRQFARTYLGL